MTIGRFQILFYTVIGICIITIITSFNSFSFIEIDLAVNWTMRFFALPILIVMIPVCYFIYLKFLRQYETKEYESEIWTRLRTIFRIFILTLAMTAIFIATTLSIIILTNAKFGDSKTVILDATIIDYYSQKSKGRTRHYIKIKDNQLERIVELKVEEPYHVGEKFTKDLKIGYWGLLYYE
jgi:hypothetical protein